MNSHALNTVPATPKADKIEAATPYIIGAIRQTIADKNITLSQEEITWAAHENASSMADEKLDALIDLQNAGQLPPPAVGEDAAAWVYAKKLCAALPPLPQSEYFSRIAMNHHLYLADMQGAAWPSLDADAITRFIARDIGPIPHTFADDTITSTYHRGIRLHRPEAQGPALTAITSAGLVIEEQYWRLGVQHRSDGPAIHKTDRHDLFTSQRWMLFGRCTREGAPAYIASLPDGTALTEMWYSNNLLHRANGPAFINRWNDSSPVYERYAINGVEGPLLCNGVEVTQ